MRRFVFKHEFIFYLVAFKLLHQIFMGSVDRDNFDKEGAVEDFHLIKKIINFRCDLNIESIRTETFKVQQCAAQLGRLETSTVFIHESNMQIKCKYIYLHDVEIRFVHNISSNISLKSFIHVDSMWDHDEKMKIS